MNRAAILVAQREVGDLVAGLGNMILNLGPVIRFALGDHNNVIEEHGSISALRDKHVCGDGIARMEFAEDAGILQLVGHSHGVHEAGDSGRIHADLAGGRVGAYDLAAQLVCLVVRILRSLRGGL